MIMVIIDVDVDVDTLKNGLFRQVQESGIMYFPPVEYAEVQSAVVL